MSAFTRISRIPVSFWRFGMVGTGGFLVDTAVLYLAILSLNLAPVPARFLSFPAAVTFTWWMNRKFTFGGTSKFILHEWASFFVASAFGGAINFVVYTVIVTRGMAHVWTPALATASGSLSGLLFNYMSARYVVFRNLQAETAPREISKRANPS